MNDRNLDHLLAQLRDAPLPAVPGSFRQDVWRSIRQRGSPRTATWFYWLFEPLLRPAMAASALALAILVGASLGLSAMEPRSMHARNALGLEVFSSTSPSLPTYLLSHVQ